MSMSAERIASSVWLRLVAISATVLAPVVLSGALGVGWSVYSGMHETIDKLSLSIDGLKNEVVGARLEAVERMGDLSSRVLSIEAYTQRGGRYTQEDAQKDLQTQAAIDARQTTLIERLDDRLRVVEQGG